MLEVKDLCFSYGARPVLDHVSFRIEEGELIFLLGANGAGKSTLLRCILGLLPNYRGEILLHGRPVRGVPARALARSMAYIPQRHHPAFSYPALDMVLMGASHRLHPFASPGPAEVAAARAALKQIGAEALERRNFMELSGGEQQMVLIARALAQQGRLLLMDEPTASLDYGNQLRVLDQAERLAAQGYAVLICCHDPQHALLRAHRVLALHGGTLLADGPPGEALNESLLQTLYQTPVRLVRTPGGTLLSPARHGFQWTPERIRFMEDAAACTDFYALAAREVANAVPRGARVCDAGCGLGFSALELAKLSYDVVAADVCGEALAVLRKNRAGENPSILEGDVFALPPEVPYDAMLFCSFGTAEQIVAAAQRQCAGKVVVARKDMPGHRLSDGRAPHGQSFTALEQALRGMGIPFQSKRVQVEMGQPLRSTKDGVRFFQAFGMDADAAAEQMRTRAQKREDPQFPYYLPLPTQMGFLVFDAKDIPQQKGDNS